MKVQNGEFCTKHYFVACSNHLPEKVQSPCRSITPHIWCHTLEFIKKKKKKKKKLVLTITKKNKKKKEGDLIRQADNLTAFFSKKLVIGRKSSLLYLGNYIHL